MSQDQALFLQDLPTQENWSRFWLLDRTVTFLNHGSFGACPIPVLEAQQRWRHRLEAQPLLFMRQLETLLDDAKHQLAAFIQADVTGLVFVPNATTGVNAVLRSLSFSPGDELLTTNQEYNACRNVIDFVASHTGATVVVASVPFPIVSPDQVVAAILEKVSPHTRIALLDHVVSQTGLIFPIQRLVRELASQGIDTLVDGAHAPGMVPLNVSEIGAAYYTGNCHKWLCGPKGAGFLYVPSERKREIRPPVISHGANSPRTDQSRFQLEFDWMGTGDPTAYLCVPEAIKFMGSLLPGGWLELMQRNHQTVLAARKMLAEKLGVPLPCPDEMVGSMAVVPLPSRDKFSDGFSSVQAALWERNFEVPLMPWSDATQGFLRISAQIYNQWQEYEALAAALIEVLS